MAADGWSALTMSHGKYPVSRISTMLNATVIPTPTRIASHLFFLFLMGLSWGRGLMAANLFPFSAYLQVDFLMVTAAYINSQLNTNVESRVMMGRYSHWLLPGFLNLNSIP